MRLYLQDCGLATPIGTGKAAVAAALFAETTDGLTHSRTLISGRTVRVGAVSGALPPLPAALQDIESRNNRLMLLALEEIAPAVKAARTRYGRDRIAVVLGSSTSGIAAGEDALECLVKTGAWPDGFHYHQQELTALTALATRRFDIDGPAYTIATACSSSAKVFASARRLMRAGLADAVIVGGADTLCRMTINGFAALELLADDRCNPFSRNRDGINIGEGASAFLIGREESDIELLGAGETSDAHHMTAPEPSGQWAAAAMHQALDQAALTPADIAYVNLHGTGTRLNDAMEAAAVSQVFGDQVPCSSTKGLTGHMLGATGGCEAGFLWLTLHPAYNPMRRLPVHRWDGQWDSSLPALRYVTANMRLPQNTPLAMLSNSFGFGGSNAAVVLGLARHD
ncbi:MAG: beta-ketoacyl-[acyl-carrier-protein] synthase family protein [Rhizomicrobium sp.]